jgi:hypothetical protein
MGLTRRFALIRPEKIEKRGNKRGNKPHDGSSLPVAAEADIRYLKAESGHAEPGLWRG